VIENSSRQLQKRFDRTFRSFAELRLPTIKKGMSTRSAAPPLAPRRTPATFVNASVNNSSVVAKTRKAVRVDLAAYRRKWIIFVKSNLEGIVAYGCFVRVAATRPPLKFACIRLHLAID
jgi:hypothetical protein